MTANRRIVINVIATYGRSLYALAVGLLCSRWVYLSLGEEDFGLFGLVGGIVVFATFLNSILTAANTRFSAVAIGRTETLCAAAKIEERSKWFNTAVATHFMLASLMMLICVPLGIWLINNWLSIPTGKSFVCVEIFLLSSFACYVSMVNVPYSATMVANQKIAELTVVGLIQSTANLLVAILMILNPGNWLFRYAVASCAIMLVNEFLIFLLARHCFRECRVQLKYMIDRSRTIDVLKFTFFASITGLGSILTGQGLQILINKLFGVVANSAMSISSRVQSHASSLASSIDGAMRPALTTAYGAGDIKRFLSLCHKATLLAVVSMAAVAIPLIVAMDDLLVVWLKSPPTGAATICICCLLACIFGRVGSGQDMAINATGKIAGYQICHGLCWTLALPLTWILSYFLGDMRAPGIAIIISLFTGELVTIYFAKKIIGLEIFEWIKRLLIPVFLTVLFSIVIGWATKSLSEGIWMRIVLSAILGEITFLMLSWFILLNASDREFLKSKFKTRSMKICKK